MFRPSANSSITIGGVTYQFSLHPSAKNMVYGQSGRRGTVYQMISPTGKPFALKVFTQIFRKAEVELSASQIQRYAGMEGLAVCSRQVLTQRTHTELIAQYPALEYAVIMPWVEGSTWQEVVISRQEFTAATSRVLASSLLKILYNLEKCGGAHCDISGPNVILDFAAKKVSLVDVEEMYGAGFLKPEKLPGGSDGYAHVTAKDGLWSAEADRFAGAVILSEILAQCDPAFRSQASIESYFDPAELQQDCPRYHNLLNILRRYWGETVAHLFSRVWASPTLRDCPTFEEWAEMISPEIVVHEPPAYTPPLIMPQPSAPAPVVEPQKTAAASPAVTPAAPNGGPVMGWRNIGPQSAETSYPSAPGAAFPQTSPALDSSYVSAPAAPSPQTAPPLPTLPPGTGSSRQGLSTMSVFWGFLATAVVVGLAIAAFGSPIETIKNQLENAGPVIYFSSGSALLALLIGGVQAWVFSRRLRAGKRVGFVLASGLGGFAGGVLTVLFTDIDPAYRWLIVGACIGGTAGTVASLAQNRFLGNGQASTKWFFFSLLANGAAWSAGWQLSAYVPGMTGMAAGAAVIVGLLGAATAILLKTSPEIEF